VISSELPIGSGDPGTASITCAGIKSGVFDAGANPSFMAAIGSG